MKLWDLLNHNSPVSTTIHALLNHDVMWLVGFGGARLVFHFSKVADCKIWPSRRK